MLCWLGDSLTEWCVRPHFMVVARVGEGAALTTQEYSRLENRGDSTHKQVQDIKYVKLED